MSPLTARTQWLVIALALVVVGAVAHGLWQRREYRGAMTELARLRADSARLAGERAALDSVYVVDTVTLREVRTRTTTRLDTLRDTLVHVDTVRVIVQEERRACDAALSTCEARVAAERRGRENAEARARLLEEHPPPPRRWSVGCTAGYGAVASAGAVRTGPGATCGASVRIF